MVAGASYYIELFRAGPLARRGAADPRIQLRTGSLLNTERRLAIRPLPDHQGATRRAVASEGKPRLATLGKAAAAHSLATACALSARGRVEPLDLLEPSRSKHAETHGTQNANWV